METVKAVMEVTAEAVMEVTAEEWVQAHNLVAAEIIMVLAVV
jgi:hypothetical protein